MPILLRSFNARPLLSSGLRPPSSSDHLRAVSPSRRASLSSVAPSAEHVVEGNASAAGPPLPFPPRPSLLDRVRSLYRRLHLNYLVPLLIILVYMLLGAFLFLWLEGGQWGKGDKPHEEERKLFLKRLEEILEDRAARRRSSRRQYLEEALLHFERQTTGKREDPWTIMSAMYFAGTLFTTIGYGDMACATAAGRVATVVYSFIGIPLMLMTLNDLGKFLYSHINNGVKAGKTFIATLGVLRPFSALRRQRDDEIAMKDVEAGQQAEVDSVASNHGSLPSLTSLDERGTPRMGVATALIITIGWIFLCAALFRAWEDWTYAESCYFMFISLSTIGLGDVSVARKDLMVLCFVFVIVGLSLVSMSISVVQQAIEDLYISLILKLLKEYQDKIDQGDGELSASFGMMRMWGSNRAAKFLMPLLSKEKKRYAMEKVEVAAKENGLDIPPILTHLDEKTGMPKILQLKEETTEGETPPELQKMVMEQQLLQEDLLCHVLPPSLILHHTAVQTESRLLEEKNEQTESSAVEESFVQTEESLAELEERETQTDSLSYSEALVQTERLSLSDATTATPGPALNECAAQTEVSSLVEQDVQTYLVESVDAEGQTTVETKNERIQTPRPAILEKDIQTEELQEERKSPSKMSNARRRLRRAFAKRETKRRNSVGETPAMSDWRDEEGEGVSEDLEGEGSVESLHWDPIDGMHAEKQLPVHKLKAFFDKQRDKKNTQ